MSYIVSSNVLDRDVSQDTAKRALEFATYFALEFKENFMVFQGNNKEELIAFIRGQKIS